MANWFSKASNVFRRNAEEVVQPFQIVCYCGQEHQGIRRQKHQVISCKGCGSHLFVLPRDVYPPPRESKRNTLAATPDAPPPAVTAPGGTPPPAPPARESLSVPTIAELPPDMELVEETPVAPLRPKKRRTPASEPVKPTPAAAPPPRAAVPRIPAGKVFTPLRLAIAGLVLGLMLVVVVLVRQQGSRSAILTIQTAVNAGRTAAAEGDWLTARDHFEQAALAFDRLRRNDPEAQEIRQLFRESQVLTRLAPLSLIELAEQADELLQQGQDEKKINEVLEGQHRLDWFLVDGPVRPRTLNPKTEKKVPAPYELDLPWSLVKSGRSIRVQTDFPFLNELVAGSGSQRVIFAAKLDAVRRDGETWVIQLSAADAFLWSFPQSYRALRLPPDPGEHAREELEQLLSRQARIMGIVPEEG